MTLHKHTGWVLISDNFIFCIRNGQETWTPAVKKGIPFGAVTYGTEGEAARELFGMKLSNLWPLFICDAKPVEKEWSVYHIKEEQKQ